MTSKDLDVSLREFEEHWSFLDAWRAARVLDALESARGVARDQARREAEVRRAHGR